MQEDIMKVLVINAGSSSLKYQLIDMDTEEMVAKGNCERIGQESGVFSHKTADGRQMKKRVTMKDHTEAFQMVTTALTDPEAGVIKKLTEVSAIGHRVAQGGSIFRKSVLVNESDSSGSSAQRAGARRHPRLPAGLWPGCSAVCCV